PKEAALYGYMCQLAEAVIRHGDRIKDKASNAGLSHRVECSLHVLFRPDVNCHQFYPEHLSRGLRHMQDTRRRWVFRVCDESSTRNIRRYVFEQRQSLSA